MGLCNLMAGPHAYGRDSVRLGQGLDGIKARFWVLADEGRIDIYMYSLKSLFQVTTITFLHNKGNVCIRRFYDDSEVCFHPRTGRRVRLPLDDGRGSPAATPRVSKPAMKGTNRTILYVPCCLIAALECLFSAAQQQRMSKTDMMNKAR